jgi:hypothetical protein
LRIGETPMQRIGDICWSVYYTTSHEISAQNYTATQHTVRQYG